MIGNNKPQKYLTNKRMYKKEYSLKIKFGRYVILCTLLGFFSKVIVLFLLQINDLKIHYNFFFHFLQFFQCNGFWCVQFFLQFTLKIVHTVALPFTLKSI
jgi:hypothetical protein